MGYLHIDNLSKNNSILMFKEVYALEKIDGTSAHIHYNAAHTDATGAQHPAKLTFFSGGANHETFTKLFDATALMAKFEAMGHSSVVVFGEAYGGKIQKMSETYGKDLKFVAFDVKMCSKPELGEYWLEVPGAESIAKQLGLDFVAYERVPATAEALNAERDRPSRQAIKNGMGEHIAEGIVVRPLMELRHKTEDGGRIIAKHKRPEFSERLSKKDTALDPAEVAKVMSIRHTANEWATPRRMDHVLDKLKGLHQRDLTTKDTRAVIDAMVEDIYREAAGEIAESPELTRAISSLTSKMFIAGVNAV
jgi:hypothetical protein